MSRFPNAFAWGNSLDAISACSSTEADDNATYTRCLRSTIGKLLTNHSTKELMSYISSETTPINVLGNCHSIGHIIGELTFKKYGSLETALSQCNSNCRSSCTHGAIGAGVLDEMGESYDGEDIAHADKEALKKLAIPYCKRNNPTCHAIGHLASIITDSDAAALAICDAVATGSYLDSCYQGVFMESAGSFVNMLFPSASSGATASSSTRKTPSCAELPERYHHACFLLLNESREPLYAADGTVSPEEKFLRATRECESLSGNDRAYCLYGIGASSRLLGFGDLYASDAVQSICDRYTTESDRNACTLGVITRFLYFDFRGVGAYCENIHEEARRGLCYNSTFQWAEQMFRVPEDPVRMCGTHQSCLTRYNTYLQVKSTLLDYRYQLF